MRILAIRGRNLASLAGRFEVDLTAGPLASAGLVAVSGPTGAGKSTILDALCLALFDRTPRLRGRGGRAVGFVQEHDREQLHSNDPRCLLRRGSSVARAEVDFLGRDGRRWRATWSVRRARRRPEGRIQPQTLQLVELESGIQHGGTKRQTLEAIEQALGLDYQAFCRSVLLAQGDFASFLEAPPTARAELLERVTGTSLYGELSRAAHRRAADERQALALLEAELSGARPLDPAARSELASEEGLLHEQLERLRRARAQAQRAVAWHEREAGLAAAEAGARRACTAAEEAWEAATPLREELEQVARVQPLRGVLAAWDEARAARDEAEAACARAEAAAQHAVAEATRRDEAAGVAQAALDTAQTDGEALLPLIAQARALDARLVGAVERCAEAQRDAEEARAARTSAEARQAASEQAHAAEQARRAAAEAERAAQEGAALLAAQWPRWEAALLRLRELEPRLRAVAAARLAAEEELAGREAAEAAGRSAWEVAQGEAQAAEEAWTRAARRSGETLRAEREAAEGRRLRLAELRDVLRRAREAQLALERAGEEAAEADAAGSQADEALAAARGEAAGCEAVLAEAERALAGAQAAMSLEEQRHELRPQEPCPLCGAREHPYAQDLPPFSRFVQEQRTRVEELRERLAHLARSEEQARARGAEAVRQARRAREAGEQARVSRDAAQEHWSREGWALGWKLGRELGLSLGSAWEPAAEEALAELEREELRGLEALAGEERAQEAARAARDGARAAAAAAREALLRAEGAAAEQRQVRAHCLREAGDLRQAEAGLLDELDAAFPGGGAWREAVRADAVAFAEGCAERVAGHRAWRARLEAAEAALVRLAGERTAAGERLAETQARAAACDVAEERLRQELEALRSARRALLEGREADVVEREQRERARAAAEGLERARTASAAARTQVAAREAARQAAQAELLRQRQRGAAREEELQEALAGVACELPRLRQLLGRDAAWQGAMRAQLDELKRARTEARTTANIRSAERREHALNAPSLEPAVARAALVTAAGDLERVEQRLRAVGGRLAADDATRARAAGLEERIVAQRARSEQWDALAELIGAHDGKKFRVFAQSLTLELLLERANVHLRELAPRYRLERVRGADLDLQVVDRDMGEEVRAVSSLSGGESFLVSLALALGLSALTARDTRVESLFVDEGFGSLDPDAQEQALAMLDALQAGGRQVVLISHVPGLSERIGAGVRVVPQGQGRSLVEVSA